LAQIHSYFPAFFLTIPFSVLFEREGSILDDEDLLNLAREMAATIVKSYPNLEGHPLIVAELKKLALTSWNCTLN